MIFLSILILNFLQSFGNSDKIKGRGDFVFIDFCSCLTPTRVLSSGRVAKSAGYTTHQPARISWGIALKISGLTYYEQDGKQYRSDKNHVLLLPKGGRYSWACEEAGECLMINFDAPERDDRIRCIEVGDVSEFLSAFSKIEHSLRPENPLRHLESMQQLYGILLFLTHAANKKYAPRGKQEILIPAMDYLLEHYADPRITNGLLAELCGISTVYFRKLFETVYGTSPIRYLHRLRMEKAKGMLLSDYDSIGQIAESVGYGSIYHFSKMFHSYVGISPTAFAATGGKK